MSEATQRARHGCSLPHDQVPAAGTATGCTWSVQFRLARTQFCKQHALRNAERL